MNCVRCGGIICPERSAFFVRLVERNSCIKAEIRYTNDPGEDPVCIHVNGDRECGKERSGYKKALLQALRITYDSDISFLDNF